MAMASSVGLLESVTFDLYDDGASGEEYRSQPGQPQTYM